MGALYQGGGRPGLEAVDPHLHRSMHHLGHQQAVADIIEVGGVGQGVGGLHARLVLEEALLLVAQAAGLLEALGFDGVLLLALHLGDAVLEVLEVGWRLHALDA